MSTASKIIRAYLMSNRAETVIDLLYTNQREALDILDDMHTKKSDGLIMTTFGVRHSSFLLYYIYDILYTEMQAHPELIQCQELFERCEMNKIKHTRYRSLFKKYARGIPGRYIPANERKVRKKYITYPTFRTIEYHWTPCEISCDIL